MRFHQGITKWQDQFLDIWSQQKYSGNMCLQMVERGMVKRGNTVNIIALCYNRYHKYKQISQ